MPTTPVLALPYPAATGHRRRPPRHPGPGRQARRATARCARRWSRACPAQPVDGQEVYYRGRRHQRRSWHLRYRAGADEAYKWEFLGGAPVSPSRRDVRRPRHPGGAHRRPARSCCRSPATRRRVVVSGITASPARRAGGRLSRRRRPRPGDADRVDRGRRRTTSRASGASERQPPRPPADAVVVRHGTRRHRPGPARDPDDHAAPGSADELLRPHRDRAALLGRVRHPAGDHRLGGLLRRPGRPQDERPRLAREPAQGDLALRRGQEELLGRRRLGRQQPRRPLRHAEGRVAQQRRRPSTSTRSPPTAAPPPRSPTSRSARAT